MKNKTITIIILLLFLSAIVSPIISSSPIDDDQSISIIYVDDDAEDFWYDSTHVKNIQEGIDNASEGDLVIVHNGTYYEHSIINKTIHLKGKSKTNTIIDGQETGTVITITADNTSVSNLTIKKAGNKPSSHSGILINSNNNTISNIITTSNDIYGINIVSASGNIITNNTIKNNGEGIRLYYASSNIISNNSIKQNYYGLRNRNSLQNNILNNTINSNGFYGIFHRSCHQTLIKQNIISDGSYGIRLWNGEQITITSNSIQNNKIGLAQDEESNNHTIFNNYFDNACNYKGVGTNNTWNISKTTGNNIIDESYLGGNYWSDYNGYDTNADGIGDTNLPYGPGDCLPLVPLNLPPIANFTFSPTNPSTLSIIQFNDTSTDPDGTNDIVNWTWTFGDGNSSYSQHPTHSYADDGEFTVTFSIRDQQGAMNTTEQNITASNTPPQATFSYIPKNPITPDTLSFTSTSIDYDGMITNWTWDFGDGNKSYQTNPSHQYDDNGTYTVTLTVKDDDGAENLTSKIIIISNSEPIANFTYSPLNPKPSDIIHFNDISTDIDGTIENWTWNFGDGNISYLQHPTHQYTNNKTYSVSLHVVDDDGCDNQTQILISVGNQPPKANFSYNPSSPSDLETIQFTDKSTDPDGNADINNWTWDFGDENSSYLQNPSHQYEEDGAYTVTLTVKDQNDSVNSATKQIIVTNVGPTADFTFSPPDPLINQNIEFIDNSTDKDGTIENWFWNFDDGNNDSKESTNHIYENPGSYNVTLNVTDDDGAISSKNITITIRESNQVPIANNDTFSTNENTATWMNVTANDVDKDGTINVSSVNITTEPNHGSTDLNDTTGEIQYNPDENFDGEDSFTYTVKDNDGNTSNEATVSITVIEPNESPVADFTFEPANPYVGDTIYFNSTSTDEDGTIEDFVWKLGDGTRLTGEKKTHEYTESDTYTVSLQVTDNDGDTDQVSKEVVVKQVVSIQIASPSSDDTVSGSIKITGTVTADEDEDLKRIDIKIDNGNWNEAEGTEKWEYMWTTTQVDDGKHTIYARCNFSNDKSTQTSTSVNVENSIGNEIPIISISFPTDSSIVSNTITFRGTVDDTDESVEKVDIKIDQGDWKQASLSEKTWEYTLNASRLSDGNHIFYARSFDGSNYSNTQSIRFIVQNTDTDSDDDRSDDTENDDSTTTDSDDTTDKTTDVDNIDSDSTKEETTAVSGGVTTFLAILSSAVIAAIGAALYIIRI